MFGNKKPQEQRSSRPLDPQAPGTDPRFDDAKRAYLERYADPIVQRARYWLAMMLLGLVALAQSIVLYNLFPLKTGVPFVVTKSDNGEVLSIDPTGARQFKPGRPEIQYFLGKFASNLMSLGPKAEITEAKMREAWSVTLGKAQNEFTDFQTKFQPLVKVRKTPSLTRTVKIVTTTFPLEDVANVRISTEERNGQEAPILKNWTLTIHFIVHAPETTEQIYTNPLGLYIDHFDVTEEMN